MFIYMCIRKCLCNWLSQFMPKTVNVNTSHMQKLIKMQRCPNTPQLTVQSATTSTSIINAYKQFYHNTYQVLVNDQLMQQMNIKMCVKCPTVLLFCCRLLCLPNCCLSNLCTGNLCFWLSCSLLCSHLCFLGSHLSQGLLCQAWLLGLSCTAA